MKLLTKDVTRNFAIGFLIGGLIVFAQSDRNGENPLVPEAAAAPLIEES